MLISSHSVYFLRKDAIHLIRKVNGLQKLIDRVRLVCLVCLVSIFASCGSNTSRPGSKTADNDSSLHTVLADTPGRLENDSNRNARTGPGNQPQSDTINISNYPKAIPPFKIRLVDGKGFTYKDLDKNKPLVLIYFQPDCPECQAFTAALAKKLPALKDLQIVMITFEDLKLVKAFDEKYHLSQHPNLKIGSEGYTFIVQKYYQIEHFPIVACFDPSGSLLRILNPGLDPERMVDLLSSH